MSDLHSIFVVLHDGRRYRLTDWLTWDHVQAAYSALEPFNPLHTAAPVTLYVTHRSHEDRNALVKHFVVRSQDDPNWNREERLPCGEVLLRRWSDRAYVGQEGAAKAWNRATGNQYKGVGGGWIYRTADLGKDNAKPVCQGWASLLSRSGYRYEGDNRYRYLAERRSMNFTRSALGIGEPVGQPLNLDAFNV